MGTVTAVKTVRLPATNQVLRRSVSKEREILVKNAVRTERTIRIR